MINDYRGDKPSTYMGFISTGGILSSIIQLPTDTVILHSKGSWDHTDFMLK